MDGFGIVLLPLCRVTGDDLADGHGMGDDIRNQTFETVNDLLKSWMRLASVVPPSTDTFCLLLQRLNNLNKEYLIAQNYSLTKSELLNNEVVSQFSAL